MMMRNRVNKTLIKAAAATLIGTLPGALHAQDVVSLSLPAGAPADLFSGARSRDVLVAQVLLDRSRHSPGVVDGVMGCNTVRAIKAYQRAHGMTVDGEIDAQLLRTLVEAASGDIVQTYTISSKDVAGPFHDVPSSMEGKAELDKVTYESPAELLAEKFHMSQSFLKTLNPGADFSKAGTKIVVIAPGEDRLNAEVASIEVDKTASAVRAYDAAGKLVATYPATVGSSTFPSPSGAMEVRAVAPVPAYYFDPSGRSWGPDKQLKIAPGPNNPVGSTWIDLSKDGYGIHGTPEPSLIGKTASHGCVRLTNWDAEELARAVSKGTKVRFV